MELFDEKFNRWVTDHSKDNPTALRLKFANTDPALAEAISQIEYRKKAGDKFSKFIPMYGRPATDIPDFSPRWFPTALSVEQASSASVAMFHASLVERGSRVLDMTMGLGSDAAAIALIDDADVTSIERDSPLCQFARLNYIGISRLHVVNADSMEWLCATTETFDYIIIDPARRDDVGHRVYNIHDCTPDVAELLPLMLSHAPKAIIKLSPMLDISATIAELHHVAKIYIVEERGEVRELLAVIDKDIDQDLDDTPIEAVSVENSFSFTRNEEASAAGRYDTPRAGEYLYEPSPAIMKAAPFKLLCDRFDIGALHPNTHLYISSCKIVGFPGKRYLIDEVIPYASKYIKRFAKEHPAASVSVRNFPVAAAVLRAKLKVKEGDAVKVFGVTLKDGQQALLVMHRE